MIKHLTSSERRRIYFKLEKSNPRLFARYVSQHNNKIKIRRTKKDRIVDSINE